MNKSGNIGSKAERAVANAANRLGFPHADRRVKRGRHDVADILLCPGVVAQVKGGDMARKASDALVSKWLEQTEQQRINAGAEHAFLVVQRAGVGTANADRWHAYWRHSWWARLWGLPKPLATAETVVRTDLAGTLAALRENGWGEA